MARQKDSIKNLVFGLLGFIVTTILGIIIPRLFLISFGSEINGLITSIKQIFAYFTLLEAGIGGATIQALYAPMANRDKQRMNEIMAASNRFYKKTGVAYIAMVLLLALIYPFVVKSDIPKYITILIILFQGESGAVKFFVSAKLRILLQVDGKSYILTNIATMFTIFSNIARIALMYGGANVLAVQAVFCIVDILQVIIIVIYTKKHYSWLDVKVKPDFKAVEQKNSVLVHQVSGLVFNNTDSIILTFFCGLKVVSVYSMYSLLFGMVASVMDTVSTSVKFAMGQIFNTDRKKFEKIQDAYETYYLAVCFTLFTVAFIFIIPFLKLYTSGVKDIDYIDNRFAILFLVFEMLNYGRYPSNMIISFAGHFKQTKNRAVLEAVINLTVSLICVPIFGLHGVLMGTIAALLYRTNDIIIYTNRTIMNRSPLKSYRRWVLNILLAVAFCFAGKLLPDSYNGYFEIILYAAVTLVVVALVFLTVNSVFERKAAKTAVEYAVPIVRKVIKKNKT